MGLLPLLAAGLRRDYHVIASQLDTTASLQSTCSWNDFESRLGRRRLRNLRRCQRQLTEQGILALDEYRASEPSKLKTALDEFYSLEQSGWKGLRGTAIASHDTTKRFYTNVAHWAKGEDLLRLRILRFDGIRLQESIRSLTTRLSIRSRSAMTATTIDSGRE